MKMFRNDEGFTLVELMVVVLIIGILVAIAIPIFNAAKGTAQVKSCYASQRTIEGAAQTYVAQGGTQVIGDLDGVVNTANALAPFVKLPLTCSASGLAYHITGGTIDGDEAAATWISASGNQHKHF
jgi:prepilin-type N-terminal cleavage/methylation domain-containing protein